MGSVIPGYYFDHEKGKYFKIEKTQTAPTSATWSSDAVKRRKLESKALAASERQARLVKNHIRRNVSARDSVAGSILSREMEVTRVAEAGRGRPDDGDLEAAAWVGGIVDHGCLPFAPSFARDTMANIPCFYVSGEDSETELGVAYASIDEQTLIGSYIPTDKQGRIRFTKDPSDRPERNLSLWTEMIRCPQMSSITYHRTSHRMMLTSREPDRSWGIYFFSPTLSSAEGSRPNWLLGETNYYQRLSIRGRGHGESLVHKSTPAPPSSPDLLCIIGTNAGLLRVRTNETISRTVPQHPAKGVQVPQEVFDQDFQQGNHNVVIAGGRQPRLWINDFRAPDREWIFTKLPSSVAHVRSINSSQVIVAALQDTMAIYDIRYMSNTSAAKPTRNMSSRPLLTFPQYRNEANFHTGWDVCPELNVVISAQEDGRVRAFSLRSGKQLNCPALNAIHMESPIKAMMFQTLQGERLPSLFVGEGPTLKKYSFGDAIIHDEA